MRSINRYLGHAKTFLILGDKYSAIAWLNFALDSARNLPSDVISHRCLRAYIAQALEALK